MPTCVVPGDFMPLSLQKSSQALSSCWKLICRLTRNPFFFWGRALILIVVECIIIFLSEKLFFGDFGRETTFSRSHSFHCCFTTLLTSKYFGRTLRVVLARTPSVPTLLARNMPKSPNRRGRPSLPKKDRLEAQMRVDVEAATKAAIEREMKRSGQSRSKVVRGLVREALRARGYELAESYDEKRSKEQ